MYTATMRYTFTEGNVSKGVADWKSVVLDTAQKAEGFVRMQLLVNDNVMLAIGTWKDKQFAETFMQTGVFRDLMARIEPLLTEKPVPELWTLEAYAEK